MTTARITVQELSRLVAQGDESSFVSKFPEPALVLASPALDSETKKVDTPSTGLPTEKAFGRTSSFDAGAYRVPPKSLSETHEDDSPTPRATPGKAFELLGKSEVLFVKKTERNPFQNMVTLGRAQNNDVIVPLSTVSKLHAILAHGPDGWTITDQRSTNGTMVDDERLEHPASAPLSDGTVVRFGPDVTAKFFTPPGLFEFLKLYESGMNR